MGSKNEVKKYHNIIIFQIHLYSKRLYFERSNTFRLSKLWSIAEKSKDEVDLYVFVTAAGKGGTLGRAYVGTVCKTDKVYRRISINRYGIKGKGEAQKNKVAYTAEVIFYLS